MKLLILFLTITGSKIYLTVCEIGYSGGKYTGKVDELMGYGRM